MALPVRLAHFCLEQVPAFSTYLPYLAYDPEHQVFLVMKDNNPTNLAWGCIFECVPHPGPGDKQATDLKGLFEIVWPAGSTIQITAAGLQTETIPHLLYYRSLRKGPLHTEFADRRVQRLGRLLLSGNQAVQPAPLRDNVLLISITIPVSPLGRKWWQHAQTLVKMLGGQASQSQYATVMGAIPQIKKLSTDVEQLLTQSGLWPHRVDPARLLSLLFPILNPAHPYEVFDHYELDREIRRQVVMPDTKFVPDVHGVEIDGYHYRSLSPLQMPAELSIQDMALMLGDTINTTQQIPTSYLMTLNAVIYDRTDAARALHRKFAIVSQQSIGPMARIIPRLGMKSENYHTAMNAMEHGHVPISAYLHMTVWAPTLQEANQAAAASEAIWRSRNFLPQHDGPASLNMIRESLPLALSSNTTYLQRDLARARTVLSSNCASLSPIAGDWKGTGRPVLLMVSRRGQLAAIDTFFNPSGGNYNCVVAGASGSGKSVLCNDLILGLVGVGAQTWLIDKGHSYDRMITTLKGDHMRFHASSDINLNPFTFVETEEEFKERFAGLQALVAQMASPSRPVTDIEDTFIEQAIKKAFANKGPQTTITDIARLLREIEDPKHARPQDLAQMLMPYTKEGAFANWYEGRATIDVMTSPLLLLELEELSSMPKLQSVVFLSLILAIRGAMERGDRGVEKCLLIDESWQFITGEAGGGGSSSQAAKFVTVLYRVARKFNLSVITVSQSLRDFLETATGQAILANSDMRFIYTHTGESLQDERLALQPYEIQLIRSLSKVDGKYAECYIKHQSGGSGVYRHIIDKIAYGLFTTKPGEVAELQRLMKKEGLSMAEAIEVMMGSDTLEKPMPANIEDAVRWLSADPAAARIAA